MNILQKKLGTILNNSYIFFTFKMSYTTNKLYLPSPNNQWHVAIPDPSFQDWDAEIAADPFPSGRLRDIDGRLINMLISSTISVC